MMVVDQRLHVIGYIITSRTRVLIFETYGGNPGYQIYEVHERNWLVNFQEGELSNLKSMWTLLK
jgi:hypothetical protein